MKYNTRFNPTVNSLPHIGHLATALVNKYEAANTGGMFIVRFDDTQKYWIHNLGEKKIEENIQAWKETLSLFFTPDKWERQSQLPPIQEIINARLVNNPPRELWLHGEVPEWRRFPSLTPYPYAPRYTLEKVVWDFYDRINLLIRGEDLMTEHSLYCHFVDELGVPPPMHYYLPRINLSNTATISKTSGLYKLEDLLKDYSPLEILQRLAKVCLFVPEHVWSIANYKWNPIADDFAN